MVGRETISNQNHTILLETCWCAALLSMDVVTCKQFLDEGSSSLAGDENTPSFTKNQKH